jgi:hypothetical protein
MAASGRPGYAFFSGVVVGEALVTAGPGGQKAAADRRPRAASSEDRAAMRIVALATVVQMRRSHRFYQRVTPVAIGLGGLRRIGQENQASANGAVGGLGQTADPAPWAQGSVPGPGG